MCLYTHVANQIPLEYKRVLSEHIQNLGEERVMFHLISLCKREVYVNKKNRHFYVPVNL